MDLEYPHSKFLIFICNYNYASLPFRRSLSIERNSQRLGHYPLLFPVSGDQLMLVLKTIIKQILITSPLKRLERSI